MRILVIGGTRFIGLATVTELAREHDVAVFHRGNTPAQLPSGVSEILGNRDELAQHRDALLAFRPEVVLDMIAFTKADATGLLEAFAGEVSRVVVASSCDVYRA